MEQLTKRKGKGRNAVAVFAEADGSGYRLEYGVWSHAKGRVLNAEEEGTHRKCQFRETHPDATYDERRAYARTLRPIAGGVEIGGKRGAGVPPQALARVMVAAAKRISERLNALVVVSDGVPEEVKAALLGALGVGSVYAPPAMGLSPRGA